MRFFTNLSARELDRILAGNAPDTEHEDIATFFRQLRSGLDETPTPAVEARHLAAVFEETRHLQPSAADPKIPAPRDTRRLRNPFRQLATRATIIAVGLAALAAFGGAAYAGALPATVQDKVAHLAHHIGLSLPDDNHRSRQPDGANNPGGPHSTSTRHTSTTDQPIQLNPGHSTENNGQGNVTQGNVTQGKGGQTNSGQHNNDNSTQTHGPQGPGPGTGTGTGTGKGGADAGQTNGDQGAQQATAPDVKNPQSSSPGTHNEQTTPSGAASTESKQQGNGAHNGAGNGN